MTKEVIAIRDKNGYIIAFDVTDEQKYPDGHKRTLVFNEVPNPFQFEEEIRHAYDWNKSEDIFGPQYKFSWYFQTCQATEIPEPIEVTMEDVEKAFGRPVRIVKRKDKSE